MNTMLDLAVLVLLGWGTSLETQPARAATGTVEDLRQFEKKLQEAAPGGPGGGWCRPECERRGLGGDDFRRNSNRSLHCRESHAVSLFGLRLRRAYTGD